MDYRLTATLLDSLGIALCVFDAQARTVLWNAQFLRLFPEHDGHLHAGEPYAANLQRFYRARLAAEDLPQIDRYVREGVLRHQNQSRPYMFQHRGRWLRVAVTCLDNGDRMRVWTDLSQAGALQTIEPAEAPQPAGLHAPDALHLLEHAGDGIAVLDTAGHILFANDRFATLYGLSSRSAALNRRYPDLARQCWQVPHAAAEYAERADELTMALNDSLHFAGVPFAVPLPGQRWIRVTLNAPVGDQVYTTHTDVSADKREESALRALTDRLRQETHHDALTGLQNRRGLESLVHGLGRQPGPHAVLFIDLDGFKAVNDSAGHATGDEVLRQAAGLLRRSVRTGDTVVRLGGDEFVVLLRACGLPQARTVGNKIVNAVGTTAFTTACGTFYIGASVGVRMFDDHLDSPDVVLHDADVACYQAKRDGRGRVAVFGDCA
ncbi:diguanylate cyclase domain-containing protein [Diaphorobacter sp.]|uniref:diguanylate cyclase domain-containing protein n=1 Tax=Diaphorobacter sp. TaxID=1934310 RepID=UPI003D0D4721